MPEMPNHDKATRRLGHNPDDRLVKNRGAVRRRRGLDRWTAPRVSTEAA
jgi:hypothetical protein